MVIEPGPRCLVCKHMACPCCQVAWCDELDEEGWLCCEGECVYEGTDWEDWQQRIGSDMPAAGVVILVAEGPFWRPCDR